jgi:hypothetical protein
MNERDEHQEMVEAALAADREASLRDMFASAALAALATWGGDRDLVARRAYSYADAMMKARKC